MSFKQIDFFAEIVNILKEMAHMKKILPHILAAFALAYQVFGQASGVPETSVSAAAPFRAEIGKPFEVSFAFDIPAGWHIYGANPGELGAPTQIALELPRGFSQTRMVWPPERPFDFMGVKSWGYSGKIEIRAELLAGESAETGEIEIPVKISMLQCADTCVPAEKKLALKLSLEKPAWPAASPQASAPSPAVAAPAENPAKIPNLAAIILGAFAGGIILNLMPCVFPVIGLKIMSFASGARRGQGEILANAVFYTAGIVLSFLALGAVLVLFKNAGEQAGWGFQLQNPIFTAGAALLFFAMGLSFAGAFEIGSSLAGRAAQLESAAREGANSGWAAAIGGDAAAGAAGGGGAKGFRPGKYLASFFSGVLAVLVASPCTAPFMGSAVGYALAAEASNEETFSVFAAIGLGMAFPYLLISAIPPLAKAMPRPGAWMEILKNLLSIPMFASAIWLMWVFSQQTGAAVALASAMLVLAVGLRAFGVCAQPHRRRFVRYAGIVAAVLSAVAAMWIAYEYSPKNPQQPASASAPAASARAISNAYSEIGGEVLEWTPETFAELRRAGRAVYVDFTASWCITCQYNKRILFSPEVMAALKKSGAVMLLGDWTNKNPQIRAELEKYGRAGVPLNIYWPAGADSSPEILPAILTGGALLDAIDKRR